MITLTVAAFFLLLGVNCAREWIKARRAVTRANEVDEKARGLMLAFAEMAVAETRKRALTFLAIAAALVWWHFH